MVYEHDLDFGSLLFLVEGISQRRKRAEIDTIKAENYSLTMQLNGRDAQISTLHCDHQSDVEWLRHNHEREMAVRPNFWFPDVPQLAEAADYCREVGFSREQTQVLLTFRLIQHTQANSARPSPAKAMRLTM